MLYKKRKISFLNTPPINNHPAKKRKLNDKQIQQIFISPHRYTPIDHTQLFINYRSIIITEYNSLFKKFEKAQDERHQNVIRCFLDDVKTEIEKDQNIKKEIRNEAITIINDAKIENQNIIKKTPEEKKKTYHSPIYTIILKKIGYKNLNLYLDFNKYKNNPEKLNARKEAYNKLETIIEAKVCHYKYFLYFNNCTNPFFQRHQKNVENMKEKKENTSKEIRQTRKKDQTKYKIITTTLHSPYKPYYSSN